MSHPPTRELNLFSIDHDDIVTSINVRGIVRTVFTHQDCCQASSQATDRHPFGVDHQPLCLVVPTGTTIRSF